MFATSWILMTRCRADFFNLPPKTQISGAAKEQPRWPRAPLKKMTARSCTHALVKSRQARLLICRRFLSASPLRWFCRSNSRFIKRWVSLKTVQYCVLAVAFTRSCGFHLIHTNRNCTFSDRFSRPEIIILVTCCNSSKPLLNLHSKILQITGNNKTWCQYIVCRVKKKAKAICKSVFFLNFIFLLGQQIGILIQES